MEEEFIRCEKCNGIMKSVEEKIPGELKCKECGHSMFVIWDPAPPPNSIDEDESDGELVLLSCGNERIKVAAVIRPITGMTSKEALNYIREGNKVIARRNCYRIWELEKVKESLERIGANAEIRRESNANQSWEDNSE